MLRLAGPEDGGDLAAFLSRAAALDPGVLVRLRGGGGRVAVHARLPFGVPVSRTVGGEVEPADVTVAAADLLPALDTAGDRVVVPRPRDTEWRSALP
ncbi:MAG TPA: hypothetical protein VE547_13200, partial [Mycobacteriales bacterium]|nr:hypothetical protein [Mycobacteriales bacterium]